MGFLSNGVLGTLFLLLAIGLTLLMFHLWGFPFDHERHKSSAPPRLMFLHRLGGWIFVAIYVLLMWDMVPRLWSYQIELPARTVAHLTLGIAIGAVLLAKVMVVRFFKHLESTLAPFLGVSLLIMTVILTGLALPYSAREAYLRMTAQDGQNFAEDRIERVRTYLPQIGFSDEAGLTELASSRGLADGRDILTKKCTQCHDMRTILAKPRTPDAWHKTVVRMSNRSTVLHPINETEQWQVTAYLIAISPTLRETVSDRKKLKDAESRSQQAASKASQGLGTPPEGYKAAEAQQIFESKCGQCHPANLVEVNPPDSSEGVSELVNRMVRNGLAGDDRELAWIMAYLEQRFVSPDQRAAPTGSDQTGSSLTNNKSDYDY